MLSTGCCPLPMGLCCSSSTLSRYSCNTLALFCSTVLFAFVLLQYSCFTLQHGTPCFCAFVVLLLYLAAHRACSPQGAGHCLWACAAAPAPSPGTLAGWSAQAAAALHPRAAHSQQILQRSICQEASVRKFPHNWLRKVSGTPLPPPALNAQRWWTSASSVIIQLT